MERWFITGTDTEVGKTVASIALLQAASKRGLCTAGYKPVACGCESTPDGIRNSDALELQRYSSLKISYEQINPIAFIEPTSPHIVSAQEGRLITFEQISGGLRTLEKQAEWVLVEGAGGWLTLLSETKTYADWVVAEQMPVILVVGVKLGCINHAMLTAEAVHMRGLRLSGWIANAIQPPEKNHQAYLSTLLQCIDAPLLGEIPYLTHEEQRAACGRYINLP